MRSTILGSVLVLAVGMGGTALAHPWDHVPRGTLRSDLGWRFSDGRGDTGVERGRMHEMPSAEREKPTGMSREKAPPVQIKSDIMMRLRHESAGERDGSRGEGKGLGHVVHGDAASGPTISPIGMIERPQVPIKSDIMMKMVGANKDPSNVYLRQSAERNHFTPTLSPIGLQRPIQLPIKSEILIRANAAGAPNRDKVDSAQLHVREHVKAAVEARKLFRPDGEHVNQSDFVH